MCPTEMTLFPASDTARGKCILEEKEKTKPAAVASDRRPTVGAHDGDRLRNDPTPSEGEEGGLHTASQPPATAPRPPRGPPDIRRLVAQGGGAQRQRRGETERQLEHGARDA